MLRYQAHLLFQDGQRLPQGRILHDVRVDWTRDRPMLVVLHAPLVGQLAEVLRLHDAIPVAWVGDCIYFHGWELGERGERHYQAVMFEPMPAAVPLTSDLFARPYHKP